MEKIMKLAALMREAKELVDAINKEGKYNILSAGVDLNDDDAFTDEKQADIFFFHALPNFGITPMRNLLKGESEKVVYKESVTVDGVKCYRLVEGAEENAKLAV